ncbi:MAG: 2TM domain-containing protein [Bacteroidota bacterium]
MLKRRKNNDEPEYVRKARKKVRLRKGFIRHFSVYSVCIAFLFALNMLTDPGEWWFLFPALSWGVAIGIHYFSVYGLPFTDAGTPEWEERELQKEIDKLRPREEARKYLPPSADTDTVDIDDHLELKEVPRPQKEKLTDYRDEDFV